MSYSHRDFRIVEQIEKSLAAIDLSIWIDYSSMDAGDRIRDVIERSISNSLAYVICLSSSSIASPWVSIELTIALSVANTRDGRFIIPLLLDDSVLPESISNMTYIDFRRPAEFSHSIERLADVLRFYEDDDRTSYGDPDDAFLERLKETLVKPDSSANRVEFGMEEFLLRTSVRLAIDCVKFDRYEGSNFEAITQIMAHFSHGAFRDAGGIANGQAIAMAIACGLANRFMKTSRPPASYSKALASFVNNEYIGDRFRKLFLEALIDLNQFSAHETLSVLVVPSIFPARRVSPFANFLLNGINEPSKGGTESTILKLWDRATYSNRLAISRYIEKYVRWSDDGAGCQPLDVRCRSGRAFSDLLERPFSFAMTVDNDLLLRECTMLVEKQLANPTPSINEFVGAFEVIAQSLKSNPGAAQIIAKFLEDSMNNALPWSESLSISIALELCTSPFVGVIESHAIILFLEKTEGSAALLSMSDNWKYFWVAPKFNDMLLGDNPFIYQWYLFCKWLGGHIPYLVKTLDGLDDMNAKYCLRRHLLEVKRKDRDETDKIMLRYASGSLPGLDACLAIVSLTDKSGGDWRSFLKEYKTKQGQQKSRRRRR